jgi:hypothetical protein
LPSCRFWDAQACLTFFRTSSLPLSRKR